MKTFSIFMFCDHNIKRFNKLFFSQMNYMFSYCSFSFQIIIFIFITKSQKISKLYIKSFSLSFSDFSLKSESILGDQSQGLIEYFQHFRQCISVTYWVGMNSTKTPQFFEIVKSFGIVKSFWLIRCISSIISWKFRFFWKLTSIPL